MPKRVDNLNLLRCLRGWTLLKDLVYEQHTNTVLRHFREMEAKGWVERSTARQGQPVLYRITELGQAQLESNKPNPWLRLGSRIDLGPNKHKATGPKPTFRI